MAASTKSGATRTAEAQVVDPMVVLRAEVRNPRTARSHEKLQRACDLISAMLEDGEWHSSNEIHRALQKEIPDGMFGRAKATLGIVHRRVKGENGARAQYEWKMPAK